MKIRLINSLILSLVLIFQACSKKEEKKEIKIEKIEITSVNVNTITKKTHPVWIKFSGKTQAFKNVKITSRVSAELKEVLFKAGQHVNKGDILYKLDDTEYKIILAQKQSDLNKNKASLNLANTNVKRYAPLVQKELISIEKLDEILATKRQFQAQVQADIAAVNQAKLNLAYCTVKATIDGQISKSLIDIGNIVSTSSTLANIVSTSFLYVNFNPSSNEVSMIKKYKSQEKPKVIVIPENLKINLKLQGELDFIDNVTNESTGTVLMRAKVLNKNNILFPGTFVNIKLFVTDELEFIAINPNIISQNQLGSYVLIVNKNNQIQTKQIKISYTNEDFSIVESGLEIGDKLVVSAITKLTDDQVVKAIEVSSMLKK